MIKILKQDVYTIKSRIKFTRNDNMGYLFLILLFKPSGVMSLKLNNQTERILS